ncbi:MAG: YdcF family protein [Eubacteriales bacterium]|nr:YdcF family protein [Eubacteriales bacterium]
MAAGCYFLAALCVLYCLGILAAKAAGTRFFLIWVVAAACLGALGWCLQSGLWDRLPVLFRRAFLILAALGLTAFVLVEALIVSGFGQKGENGLSYLVVLGAQMKENGPSTVLRYRLDRAFDYLEDNPDTLCVLCGGRGGNEPVSEAEGMYRYLTEKGLDPDRLILEDASVNTVENLQNARKLIPDSTERIGVVTSNFHIYRSVRLARAQGFPEAVGIGAPSGAFFLPNNMLREFFGVVKDWACGNMRG